MKKADVFGFRDNLASYLNEVNKTEVPLVICKYKKPIVVIVPPKKELVEEEDVENFFGFMKTAGNNKTGEEYLNKVRRNKREKKYVRNLRKGIKI